MKKIKKFKEAYPIKIRVPKKLKLIFPKSLSVSTISSWLVYGLNSAPPTPEVCTAAQIRKGLINYYGSQEPTYTRAITIKQEGKTHIVYLTGRPDCIEHRVNNLPTVIELRTFSSSSSYSRERAIRLSKIKIYLYLGLLGLPQGKIMLFDVSQALKQKQKNSINLIPVEYVDQPVSFNPKAFRLTITEALKMYTLRGKMNEKVSKKREMYRTKMEKLGYF